MENMSKEINACNAKVNALLVSIRIYAHHVNKDMIWMDKLVNRLEDFQHW